MKDRRFTAWMLITVPAVFLISCVIVIPVMLWLVLCMAIGLKPIPERLQRKAVSMTMRKVVFDK
jgi:hypothetical protein